MKNEAVAECRTELPIVNESGYYEIRLESIGGLGANLCGKMLGELGLYVLGLNSSSFSSYGSEKTGTPATQADNTIGAAWQKHHSRGNAAVHLRGDVYKHAQSHYHAQKLREELWFYMMEHPEGVLDYATAFDENMHPIFTKKLRATLADFRCDLLTDDTSPWPNAQGVHIVFSFQFSPIE